MRKCTMSASPVTDPLRNSSLTAITTVKQREIERRQFAFSQESSPGPTYFESSPIFPRERGLYGGRGNSYYPKVPPLASRTDPSHHT